MLNEFRFYSFGLLDKIITYVKNKGLNLNTLTNVLKSIVYCSLLQLPTPFVKLCFGHAMSKVVQYAIDDVKVCCRNPTLAKCGGEAQHLEKLEVWSLSGLPNVQSSTSTPKTPHIEVFLMSLERS